jgi:hypothetical protein
MVGYPHQGMTFEPITNFSPEWDSGKLNRTALAQAGEKADGT